MKRSSSSQNKGTKKEDKKRKRGGTSSKRKGDGGGKEKEEDTATPEGNMMAQALSTFSPSEQARFEAFRRSTFPADAVSSFVSSCLLEASAKRYAQRNSAKTYLNASDFGVSTFSNRMALESDPIAMNEENNAPSLNAASTEMDRNVPNLSELVAPGASEEITIVVSALAKAYAQKLVRSARNLATSEGYSSELKLLPQHLLEAHRHRVNAGIDPGFFMQSVNRNAPISGMGQCSTVSGNTTSSAAALGIPDKYRLKLEAALQAQKAYDSFSSELRIEKESNNKPSEKS